MAMKLVKVYGPGCRRCEATAARIAAVVAADKLSVQLESVTDIAAIAAAGVLLTPAVTVDGRLVMAGGFPSERTIRGWFS